MATITLKTIQDAEKRISEFIKRTPLAYSKFFSELCNGTVYLKLENQQFTDSFKLRGALNRMMLLSAEERIRGVVTASSGNHALGVSLASKNLGISAIIVVPTNVSKAKLNKMKEYDIKVVQEGDFEEIYTRAREISTRDGLTYISSYNDLGVIAGQGTIGLEIYEEIGQLDSIIVPVGGGSLISGIAIAVKSLNPSIEIIGVQTEGASTMYESWKAGRVVHIEEHHTLAEGLLGGLDPEAITLELVQKNVDELVLVKERSIEEAIRLLWKKEGQMVEGAGATVIAHILEEKQKFAKKKVVAVVSGGNIEDSLFQEILRTG